MNKEVENKNNHKFNGLIYLVRHGEVESGHKKRYIGSTDLDLSPRGEKQARLLFKDNPLESFLCFSSNLTRAKKTADLALRNKGINIKIDPNLREVDFGLWEDLTFNDIKRLYPREVADWAEFNPDFTFPGGESIFDFLMRVTKFGKSILKKSNSNILVFTHGGVIRALICYFLGLEPSKYLLFEIKPASITTIKISHGSGVLLGLDNSLSITEK
jgi:alpha-ribazole phosphatase